MSLDLLFFRLGVTEVGVLAGVDTVGVLSPASSALPFLGGWYRGGRVVSSVEIEIRATNNHTSKTLIIFLGRFRL